MVGSLAAELMRRRDVYIAGRVSLDNWQAGRSLARLVGCSVICVLDFFREIGRIMESARASGREFIH